MKKFLVKDWVVDPNKNQISKEDVVVQLEPRVMRLLVLFAENSNQVISKDLIVTAVWDNKFSTDNSVTMLVSTLRKLLGDDAKKCSYIKTYPKKGYQLVAEVSELPVGSTKSVVGKTFRYLTKPMISALVVLMSVTSLIIFFGSMIKAETEFTHSIYVQEPKNLTGNENNAFLAYSISDRLITKLSKSNSNVHLLSQKLDEKNKIKSNTLIVEGSLLKYGQGFERTVRITQNGSTLWAGTYTFFEDQFQTGQNKVISDIFKITNPEYAVEAKLKNVVPEMAYQLYLKGRYYQSLGGKENSIMAFSYYHDAIEEYPEFSEAYAGIADVYSYKKGYYVELTPAESRTYAQEALGKALQIDPDNIQARISLVILNFYQLKDLEKAYEMAKSLLNRIPNSSEILHITAMIETALGYPERAIKNIDFALKLSPLSPKLMWDRAWIYFVSGYSSKAHQIAKEAKRFHPRTDSFKYATILLSNHDSEGAYRLYKDIFIELEEVLKLSESQPYEKFKTVTDFQHGLELALEIISSSTVDMNNGYWPIHKALLYAYFGNYEESNRNLQLAAEYENNNLIWLKNIQLLNNRNSLSIASD
ncbi:winged helix-turn-helix domain-containing protein [Marinicella meishanensis]|uniref:winged helix-turn-helix domain-containing protein n=1 Tax=Marinicella meishanensis TaxID=2873263 RepID=UPI001CC1606E|nr:transcriptional regulator [Marinicella sp. NBU2979]